MKTLLRLMLLLAIAIFQLGFMGQNVMAQSGDCQGEIGPECLAPSSGIVEAESGVYFTRPYTATIRGGYVAHGVGMRNAGHGTIVVADVPAGSKVVKAYLFWALIGPTSMPGVYYNKGFFNMKLITGTLIGKSDNPSWYLPETTYTMGYRADVTAYALPGGNGTYSLAGFASGRTAGENPWDGTIPQIAPLLEGASLVIVYSNPLYPMTTIRVYNGVKTILNYGVHLNVAGINATGLAGPAFTTFIGGDGQSTANPASSLFATSLPSVVWDGKDPNGAGADYPNGNLWDTMTADLHTLVDPPEPDFFFTVNAGIDSFVWVAQVFSYASGNQDTDGDGLKDGWELNGIPYGFSFPAYGADMLHKDLFVEADYMSNLFLPDKASLDDLVAVFNNAPVLNPDGTTGIHLHLDTGGAAYNEAPGTYPQYNLGGGDAVPISMYLGTSDANSCTNYNWNDFQTIKNAHFKTYRQGIFHYMIFAYNLSPACASTLGISRNKPLDADFIKGASDFIVSLGSLPSQGSMLQREGTFLHELGHNLGLRDGGTDKRPNKPNYLSVMNAGFQMIGLYNNGQVYLDYSRQALPALNETYLYEVKGLGPLALNHGIIWYCNGARHTTSNGAGPIDWNCNGVIDSAARASDINGDLVKSTLTSQNDWLKITFKAGGFVGTLPITATALNVTSKVNAVKYDEFQALGWSPNP